MLVSSVGLNRLDLIGGLAVNFLFLTLCLLHDLKNRWNHRRFTQWTAVYNTMMKKSNVSDFIAYKRRAQIARDNLKRDEDDT